MDAIPKIGALLDRPETSAPATASRGHGSEFASALLEAIRTVDGLQKEGEAAQQAYTRHEDIDLHDVLIRVEEAEVAFKTMMEVRNKLVDAYREIMRMGA
jgi:flagellar hook-basal body complex protein FliE